MEYLKRFSVDLNDYFVEAKNALLRTDENLRLVDEETIDPRKYDATVLERRRSFS
jgi:hypothetical protein